MMVKLAEKEVLFGIIEQVLPKKSNISLLPAWNMDLKKDHQNSNSVLLMRSEYQKIMPMPQCGQLIQPTEA